MAEVVDRFGWNLRRRQLLDGLADAIELLAAAGCRRLWLNGSFVTAKEEPADFDACWDTDAVDLDVLDRSGSGLSFAEFFRNERDAGRKGIVVLRFGDPS